MKKRKLLVVSTFPAPYRVKLFQILAAKYEIDLFFETGSDQNRNKEWFATTDEYSFAMLNCLDGKKKYRSAMKNIDRYDVVFIYDYWTKTQMRLQLRCRLRKVPFVLNCDGALPATFTKRNIIKDTIKRFFIKDAAMYMAGGENARKYFIHYGASSQDIVVHNFSSMAKKEIEDIAKLRWDKKGIRDYLNLPDKRIVLGIGQFIERKGFDLLLQAWDSANTENAFLVIVGGGEMENRYKQFLKRKNITNVRIEGYRKPEELNKYYYASDVFVLPTREDIWGLVINEAMAFGLPIITTTSCGAGLELIEDDKNGRLVPVDNVNCLAEALEKYLMSNDNELEDIARINKEIILNYSLDYMALKHEEVIESLNATVI